MRRITHLDITVDGTVYRLRGIGLEVQFAAAERLRAHRDAQFDRRLQGCMTLEGNALNRALELAFAQHQAIVSDAEVLQWLQTLEGTIFILWRALGRERPDLSEADTRDLYSQLNPSQLTAIARFLVEAVAPGSAPQTDHSTPQGEITR